LGAGAITQSYYQAVQTTNILYIQHFGVPRFWKVLRQLQRDDVQFGIVKLKNAQVIMVVGGRLDFGCSTGNGFGSMSDVRKGFTFESISDILLMYWMVRS
jgi:hypothetical protein